ncbi:hypothetical protein BT69DRAFT_1317222 [Atractiella rhizophila]|nr:hypothetical protein BT69DRAFT_1317222 [Atractiella rhizophila]
MSAPKRQRILVKSSWNLIAQTFFDLEEEAMKLPHQNSLLHCIIAHRGFPDSQSYSLFKRQQNYWLAYISTLLRYSAITGGAIHKAAGLSSTLFAEALRYYGEEDKSLTTTEFFGTFKEFVTSYKNAKAVNQAAEEQRANVERLKNAAKEREAMKKSATIEESSTVMDDVLAKIRDGNVGGGRKGRAAARVRDRERDAKRTINVALANAEDGEEGSFGKDLQSQVLGVLSQLREDGFETKTPPATPLPVRRSRRTRSVNVTNGEDELPMPHTPGANGGSGSGEGTPSIAEERELLSPPAEEGEGDREGEGEDRDSSEKREEKD